MSASFGVAVYGEQGGAQDNKGDVAIAWREAPCIHYQHLSHADQKQNQAGQPEASFVDRDCHQDNEQSLQPPRDRNHASPHFQPEHESEENNRREEHELFRVSKNRR